MMHIYACDNCEKCLNRNINKTGGCDWKKSYETGVQSMNAFLEEHKEIEFYGSITARCDYFFADPDKAEKACCG